MPIMWSMLSRNNIAGRTTSGIWLLPAITAIPSRAPNLVSRDPDGDALVSLFNPRLCRWEEHFKITAGRVAGLTAVGRTTVFLLEMNADQRVDLRLINQDEDA